MHHGFNASRTTGFAIGDTAGRAGFAVLAIDAFQHGARAASATDDEHALRGGVPGPDGFAEAVALDVSARTFGLFGAEDGLALYPGYPLGAFEQFAADAMSAVRFVHDGDPSPLRAADPRLATLAFDPDRIAFVGNSMGAVVGTSVATVEADVGAFVLNVLPGSIVETLAESGEFRSLSEDLLLPQVGVTASFDEIDRHMLFDPSVDLMRWALEPVDPLALARAIPRDGPDLLVQLAGHDEVAAPTASESAVAAAGLAGVGDFAFATIEPIGLPRSGAPGDPAVAAVRFDAAMHGMLEVHLQPSRYDDPLLPPLSPRPATVFVANPIDAVHAQLETFLTTFAATGHATIEDTVGR